METCWKRKAPGAAAPLLAAMPLVAALCVAGIPTRAIAEDAGETAGPTSSVREELMQRWDLNADGRVDETEAEVARSRMRRERMELRDRSERHEIDPLTGRPRGALAEDGPPGPGELLLVPGRPGNLDEKREDRPADAGAGMRPPRITPTLPGRPGGSRPEAAGSGSGRSAAGRAEEGKPAAASLNAGRPRAGVGIDDRRGVPPSSPIMTGGSRAGAPAIRPGYGASGPKVDLNAGRLPAGLPGSRGLPPRGGFVPARPGSGPATAAPPRTGMRPATPTPATAPRRRVSAEEIGGP